MKKILLIDDDSMILMMLRQTLQKAGYEVITAESGDEGLARMRKSPADLIVTDYMMPGKSGLEMLVIFKQFYPDVPVILLTAHGDVALTIKSIQMGATDYIEKPVHSRELLEIIKRGIAISEQNRSIAAPFSPVVRKNIEENTMVGKSTIMREIFKNIGHISLNRVNILITGETGTGKELIARLIHFSGITREHPFITINCSPINDDGFHKELFGYFNQNNAGETEYISGKFEQAGEGTIFFDEISDLSDNMQIKISRILEDMEYEHPGTGIKYKVNSRIIGSTNKDPLQLISTNRIREELFYRLNVFSIDLPPLRKRKEDISELTFFFINKFNRKFKKQVSQVADGVFDLMKNYDWPGNIRELENTIQHAMITTKGIILEKESISLVKDTKEAETNEVNNPAMTTLAEIEKHHIRQVLNNLKWNKVEAAKVLDISRPTLNAKIEKYQISSRK